MPDLRREFQKNDRLATHTALGELFIPDEYVNCKRVLTEAFCGKSSISFCADLGMRFPRLDSTSELEYAIATCCPTFRRVREKFENDSCS